MRLPARALAAIAGPDLPTIPAGAEVHVTAYETLGSGSWGDYAVEWQGGRYQATPAQIEILPPDPCLSFGDLVDDLVGHGDVLEEAGPPSVSEVLDLLRELDRQHDGGEVDRAAYQARKAELLARIKRVLGEP